MVQRVVLEQLIGYYGGGYDVMKRNIYDNYYKTSSKAYGGANFTWKPWLAKATRVSSVSQQELSEAFLRALDIFLKVW